jgi:hypothetical protein
MKPIPYYKLLTSHSGWLSLLLIVLLSACNQHGNKPLQQQAVTKLSQTTSAAPTGTITDTDSIATDECPRGAAEPVIKKDIYPKARFALQPDKRTGIETLDLPNGDKLTINQSGCEYYVLTFRFETSRFTADTTDIIYWSTVALAMMQQVNKGLDTPLEIDVALKKLSARIDKDELGTEDKLKLDDEIDFGGPDPRQYLIISRIQKIGNQRYAVELSLNYGPI